MEKRLQIAKELRLKAAGYDLLSDEQFATLIFRAHSTLRLSDQGLLILSRFYKEYEFRTNTLISIRGLILLSKELTIPYYLSELKFVVFSEEVAMMIALCGGVDMYLKTLIEHSEEK